MYSKPENLLYQMLILYPRTDIKIQNVRIRFQVINRYIEKTTKYGETPQSG